MNVPAAGQKIVIVGASGMVGGYALRYALDRPAVERVTIIAGSSASRTHASPTFSSRP
jgi:N-acetyl-gamma-glutamylphosphate reductase